MTTLERIDALAPKLAPKAEGDAIVRKHCWGQRKPPRGHHLCVHKDHPAYLPTLSLYANLPYGSTTSMLEPHVFAAWTTSIVEKAHATFSEIEERNGHIVAVLGAHGDLQVEVRCKPDGIVSLKGVANSGFRMVRVPRVWDDPGRREAEKGSARRTCPTGRGVRGHSRRVDEEYLGTGDLDPVFAPATRSEANRALVRG